MLAVVVGFCVIDGGGLAETCIMAATLASSAHLQIREVQQNKWTSEVEERMSCRFPLYARLSNARSQIAKKDSLKEDVVAVVPSIGLPMILSI